MNSIFILIIGFICNFVLLIFLARTNAYRLLRSEMPKEFVEWMYDGDSENSTIFTNLINLLSFIICVIGGAYLAPEYGMEFWPFIVIILAKLWTKNMAKTKIRLYVIQNLVENKCSPENFYDEFVLLFSTLMKMLDINYTFLNSDYPTNFEITTAFMGQQKHK